VIATSKWLAIVAVAFVAGSFIASPELRAYAANTVRSIDIVDGEVKTADLGNNAVTAGKIKDGEIKEAEIATAAVGQRAIAPDSVGAAELIGVTELEFERCVVPAGRIVPGNGFTSFPCNVASVDPDDTLVGTWNGNDACITVANLQPINGAINVGVSNNCPFDDNIGGKWVGVVVFDKVLDSRN
jgi:hypothetical protein